MSADSHENFEEHTMDHLHSIETIGGFTIFFLIVIIFSLAYLFYKIKLMSEIKEQPLMSVQEQNLDFGNINEEDPDLTTVRLGNNVPLEIGQ